MIKTSQDEWLHFDPLWNVTEKLNGRSYASLSEKYGNHAIDAVLQKLYIDAATFVARPDIDVCNLKDIPQSDVTKCMC